MEDGSKFVTTLSCSCSRTDEFTTSFGTKCEICLNHSNCNENEQFVHFSVYYLWELPTQRMFSILFNRFDQLSVKNKLKARM